MYIDSTDEAAFSRSAVFAAVFAAALLVANSSPAAERQPAQLDDLYALRTISDPQISPNGDWVAYTVTTLDREQDRETSDIFMTSWDGARTLRLTGGKEKEYAPRFSPDGRYLAFLSQRADEQGNAQIWLLARAGGEGEPLTEFKGNVLAYAWSADSGRLAIIAEDPKNGTPRPPTPIVIDRFQFKEDVTGYLGKRRQHLYLFDIGKRKTDLLTSGDFDDHLPAWSPDGSTLAFVTKRGPDPDRHNNWEVYSIEPKPGAVAQPLTTNAVPDCEPDWESSPAWSPDGQSIACPQGGPERLIYYAGVQLAIASAKGGPPRLPTRSLDRNVTKPRWSADGNWIYLLLEDDRSVYLGRLPARSVEGAGAIERLTTGHRVISDYALGPAGKIAILSSTTTEPAEIFALRAAAMRPLTRMNEALMGRLQLGATEEISFKSKDGTQVNGLLLTPPGFQAGRKYPAIVRVHGGPVSQFQNEFDLEWQILAAQGYLVIGANPRGSSGRGEDFQKAIFADWGHPDAEDVLAAVDHVLTRGIADPARLGIGGWSYGGILTNAVIAQDARFKAATSGAGSSNALAGYGTDMYIREYEQELGVPWRHTDAYLRLSTAFLHADRIRTPTLFLCGDQDFNVPLLNSEQMYQALRSLGLDTQLIIYPGESHSISRPSFQRDVLARYIAWYDRYLKLSP